MPAAVPDVLLITDDPQLRELVESRRPSELTLQCLKSQELTPDDPACARQVWIDLDCAAHVNVPLAERRVYFRSRSAERLDHDTLPAGLFIPKPCTPAVFEVLWAGVATRPPAAERAPEDSGSVALTAAHAATCAPATPTGYVGASYLPGWLLDFHDLDLKSLCRKCVTSLGARLGYADTSLYLHLQDGLLTLAETTHRRTIDLAVRLDGGQAPPVAAGGHGTLMVAVARSGRILQTQRVSAEFERLRIPTTPERPYKDESCLIAPLMSGQRLWGVLNFSGAARSATTELGLPLEEIFTFLGRALHHACLYDQARTEARIDSLTGLYNLRGIMEILEREIRRAQRYQSTLAVLMLDLDRLKAVNDEHGHAAGDSLLRHVAGRIGAVLRQFDGAARVGGDEFVIVLPGSNLLGARQVARRLAESIREDAAYFRDRPLPITASIGVAEWRSGWDARRLVEAADQAMYSAKSQGGDRLVCQSADQLPVHPAGAGHAGVGADG